MAAGPAAAPAVASARYRLYTGSQAVSVAGAMMSLTALYWLTLRIAHGNAAELAILVSAQFLPVLLIARRAGSVVARHRAGRVLIVTNSVEAAGSLALALPLLAGWTPVWYLWAVAFAVGCASAVDVAARQTFMRDLVGDAELRRGTSLYAAATGLAKIVGPGVAGVLIAASGEAAAFLADAASFLGVIGVLVWLAGRVQPRQAPGGAGDGQARRLRWLLDLPGGIRVAAAMALLIGGFGIQFEVTNPLMATHVFHEGSFGFGLMGTCGAVGAIAGSFYSARRPDPTYREFLRWAVLFGVAETAAALMPVTWAYDALLAVVGAATQLFATSATVYVQKSAGAAQRGHALSAYNTGFMGFVPAGSFAVAGVAGLVGVRWALLTPGLVIALCGALALLIARRAASPAPGTVHDRGVFSANSADRIPGS